MTEKYWLDRYPIIDDAHASELSLDASTHLFTGAADSEHGAAEMAYKNYVTKQKLAAAAHHLVGWRIAKMTGDAEAMQRHANLYKMHLIDLGLDPSQGIPAEIESNINSGGRSCYKFKGHKADNLLKPTLK